MNPKEGKIFKVGDKVRISAYKGIFTKGYKANWTNEIFVIDKVLDTKPITYKIKDLKGEDITGCFYSQELQLTLKIIFLFNICILIYLF